MNTAINKQNQWNNNKTRFFLNMERDSVKKAWTGQSKWCLSSSMEEKGGGQKELSTTIWEKNDVDKHWRTKPGLGCWNSFTWPGGNSLRGPTESACRFPTWLRLIPSKAPHWESESGQELTPKVWIEGSNNPSKTTNKSQVGTLTGCAGLKHLTPCINKENRQCLSKGTSADPDGWR